MKIVYVTGCLGFIGSYFTRKVLEEGWYVYGVDKCTYSSNKEYLSEFSKYDNFVFYNKDINEIDYLNDCDFVVNFAAESHVDNSINNSEEFMKSNILGVKNLLDLVRNKHINCVDRPTFVQISTDEVYGDIDSGFHTETDILKPSNPYSAAKAAADMLVIAWSRTYDLNYIILRPTNNYGIGQYPEKLIPLSIKNIYRNKKIKLHNNGTPVRTWLHVKDTANAVFTAITIGRKNEIYNISGNYECKNIEVIQKICSYMKNVTVEGFVDFNYSRSGQDVRYAINSSKLMSLGWVPVADFDTELEKIVSSTTETSFFYE